MDAAQQRRELDALRAQYGVGPNPLLHRTHGASPGSFTNWCDPIALRAPSALPSPHFYPAVADKGYECALGDQRRRFDLAVGLGDFPEARAALRATSVLATSIDQGLPVFLSALSHFELWYHAVALLEERARLDCEQGNRQPFPTELNHMLGKIVDSSDRPPLLRRRCAELLSTGGVGLS